MTIEQLKFIDEVHGEIIGGDSFKVALVAPNGNIQRRGTLERGESPQEWAKAQKDFLLEDRTGDRKPLSDYPSLVETIYGKGEWEVRIWD